MPAPAELLESSRRIANDAFALAVAWHAFIAAGAFAVHYGRVSERRAGEMLVILLASVSGISFAFDTVFNGVVCGVLALLLVAAGRGMAETTVQLGSDWAMIGGAALMMLGWAYPEFADRPAGWIYGAPLGLLPCPTLAFLVGATFFFGLGARLWSLLLAAAGLFYGLFGALRLGITLDLLLVLGSVALAVSALLPMRPALPRPRPAG